VSFIQKHDHQQQQQAGDKIPTVTQGTSNKTSVCHSLLAAIALVWDIIIII